MSTRQKISMFVIRQIRMGILLLLLCTCVLALVSCRNGSRKRILYGPSTKSLYLEIGEQGQLIAYLSISQSSILWVTSDDPAKWRWGMSREDVEVRVDTSKTRWASGSDIVFNVYYKNIGAEKVVFFKKKDGKIHLSSFKISRLDSVVTENRPIPAENVGNILIELDGQLVLAPENLSASEVEKKLVENGFTKIVLESNQEEKFTFRVSEGLKGLYPFREMAPGKYRITLCDFNKSVEVEITR